MSRQQVSVPQFVGCGSCTDIEGFASAPEAATAQPGNSNSQHEFRTG
ncbi:hypothetical protein V1290_001613 [Bradyrhizobium sp. AZCC 1578]